MSSEARQQRVAQRGHLSERVRRDRLGHGAVPRSPFVDGPLDAARGVEVVEHGRVAVDEAVEAVAFLQQLEPLLAREARGRPLARVPVVRAAAAHVRRVVVHRPSPQPVHQAAILLGERREEPAGAVVLPAARARADEAQIHVVAGHPGREAAELAGVAFRRHVAAAAPRLVADAPVANTERRRFALCRPLVGQRRRAGRRVARGGCRPRWQSSSSRPPRCRRRRHRRGARRSGRRSRGRSRRSARRAGSRCARRRPVTNAGPAAAPSRLPPIRSVSRVWSAWRDSIRRTDASKAEPRPLFLDSVDFAGRYPANSSSRKPASPSRLVTAATPAGSCETIGDMNGVSRPLRPPPG